MKTFGVVAVAIGSLVIGLAGGEWFYRLFLSNVPAAALSDFSRGSAHGVFILYGLVLGGVIFLWSWMSGTVMRFFSGRAARS